MRIVKNFLFGLVLGTLPAPLLAHEFWIDTDAFQVQTGAPVEADLRNGQKFKGIPLPYLAQRATRFEVWTDGKSQTPEARDGDRPAFHFEPAEGLNVLVYEAAPSTITYKTWDIFANFVAHKNFGDIANLHKARGLPEEKFRETYTRYCKALIGVGSGQGADKNVGLLTEFIAITNPYDATFNSEMQVDLYYNGAPRPEVQVEVYERNADKEVTVTKIKTDANGRARFAVKPNHSYMVDAVVLREPNAEVMAETDAVWQSLWASMTFAVPQ